MTEVKAKSLQLKVFRSNRASFRNIAPSLKFPLSSCTESLFCEGCQVTDYTGFYCNFQISPTFEPTQKLHNRDVFYVQDSIFNLELLDKDLLDNIKSLEPELPSKDLIDIKSSESEQPLIGLIDNLKLLVLEQPDKPPTGTVKPSISKIPSKYYELFTPLKTSFEVNRNTRNKIFLDGSIIPGKHSIIVQHFTKIKDINFSDLYNKKYILYEFNIQTKTRKLLLDTRKENISISTWYHTSFPATSVLEFNVDSCKNSLCCKGCVIQDYPEENKIYNKDYITYKRRVSNLRTYYEIISIYEDKFTDNLVIPRSHNILVDQIESWNTTEEIISIYNCGGVEFIVYKVVSGFPIIIFNNNWKGSLESWKLIHVVN
jgi:hypothetical protein